MEILLLTYFFMESCNQCKKDEACLKALKILDQTEYKYEGFSQAYKESNSLLKLGNASGPALLCKLSKTDDKTLRAIIVRSLGNLKYKPSFPELQRMAYNQKDHHMRSHSVVSLFQIDPARSESILIDLKDKETEWYIRIKITKCLGSYNSNATAEALKILLRDVHPMVRKEAAWSLYTNQGDAAISTLQSALKKETDLNVEFTIKDILKMLSNQKQ